MSTEQLNRKPSKDSLIMQEALRHAVRKELEKKRKLGHYYVTWEDGKVVMHGDDAPKVDE